MSRAVEAAGEHADKKATMMVGLAEAVNSVTSRPPVIAAKGAGEGKGEGGEGTSTRGIPHTKSQR